MIYFTVIKLVFFNVNYPQNHVLVFRQLKPNQEKAENNFENSELFVFFQTSTWQDSFR